MTEKQFEILENTIGYQGFFKLIRYQLRHTLFSGGWSNILTREVLSRGHAVAVLPYDPLRDKVVLVEQFRAGAMTAQQPAWLVEIVAGIIEEGETPETVAHREMQEEAGCQIQELIPIYHFFVSPGGASETTRLFCARINSEGIGGIHGVVEENEDILVHLVSFDQVMNLLATGTINSAPAIIALQWLALNRAHLQNQWR